MHIYIQSKTVGICQTTSENNEKLCFSLLSKSHIIPFDPQTATLLNAPNTILKHVAPPCAGPSRPAQPTPWCASPVPTVSPW